MTRHLRELRALVLSVLTLAGCIAGDPGADPDPVGDSGGSSASGTPDPGTPQTGASCALQPGDYYAALVTTDAGCPAARQDIGVRQDGALADASCTASSTAACETTITCMASSGPTMMTSTLVVTTRGASATGTATVRSVTTAPTACHADSACPVGYCLAQIPGQANRCFQVAGTQQCHYSATITKV